MILRDAFAKCGYGWQDQGKNMPEMLMAIFLKTGVPVEDPGAHLNCKRLDLPGALDYVFRNQTL